jgi:uncharacterized protein (TIGR03067 family)
MKRKMGWLMLLVALLVLSTRLGAQPGPDPEDDGTKDEKAMQGTWSLSKAERDGKASDKDISGVKLVIMGKKMTIRDRGKDEPVNFTLDAKKKPREINLVPPEGKGKEIAGIYKLEKDKLTICFSVGGPRPKEFASKEGHTLLEFKKDKAEEKEKEKEKVKDK